MTLKLEKELQILGFFSVIQKTVVAALLKTGW